MACKGGRRGRDGWREESGKEQDVTWQSIEGKRRRSVKRAPKLRCGDEEMELLTKVESERRVEEMLGEGG
jgi:hypothetical protein